ncbi:MAG: NAD(P)/FAD-dependent oxidoreductase [Lachnospiraceae bacterium]|nr:NAD(P)/FAD-dependent oxidoreductase [Lachnospiraceae bacterium]
MYDVIIIGGGVVGCCIARELSKIKMRIAVLEKNSDIGEGATKANSGIVHAGYDAAAGTLKALLNVRGNKMMKELADELDFPFINNGSLVLCFEENIASAENDHIANSGVSADRVVIKNDRSRLEELLDRGRQNGVAGLKILTGDAIRRLEPAVSQSVTSGLYAPTGGIVCPFGLTYAMAENAAVNGVEFYRQTKVVGIEKKKDIFYITCDRGVFEGRLVINVAGIYADLIHNMVSNEPMTIRPRRGEYVLYDKGVGGRVSHTVFQLPGAYGKGVLVTPTVHGNLLVGPTAEDIEDKEAVNTTAIGSATVMDKAAVSIGKIAVGEVITSFAGLRAHGGTGDFTIKEVDDVPGFLDVAGIDSPGLTAAPAIGEYVAQMVREILPAEDKKDFKPERRGIKSGWGEVICRCERITKEEIYEAIRRTPGATSIDGIKRRTRAGMGRCQGGFCSPRIIEILAQELGKEPWEITKAGAGSEILFYPD